jgi:hypothetical protein
MEALKIRSQMPIKVLKCGAGKSWIRSVGAIVRGIKRYYIESGRGEVSYTN